MSLVGLGQPKTTGPGAGAGSEPEANLSGRSVLSESADGVISNKAAKPLREGGKGKVFSADALFGRFSQAEGLQGVQKVKPEGVELEVVSPSLSKASVKDVTLSPSVEAKPGTALPEAGEPVGAERAGLELADLKSEDVGLSAEAAVKAAEVIEAETEEISEPVTSVRGNKALGADKTPQANVLAGVRVDFTIVEFDSLAQLEAYADTIDNSEITIISINGNAKDAPMMVEYVQTNLPQCNIEIEDR